MEESDPLENYENVDGETRAVWQQAMLLSIPGIVAMSSGNAAWTIA